MSEQFNTSETVESYIYKCHRVHHDLGWWEGQEDRDLPCKLLLMYTEVTEAADGIDGGDIYDDKLTSVLMEEAELADISIRALDYLGRRGFNADGYKTIGAPEFEFDQPGVDQRRSNLLTICQAISRAVEGLRRGNEREEQLGLLRVVAHCLAHAKARGFFLWTTIDAKIKFNEQRADHKLENRAKKGGKKF